MDSETYIKLMQRQRAALERLQSSPLSTTREEFQAQVKALQDSENEQRAKSRSKALLSQNASTIGR